MLYSRFTSVIVTRSHAIQPEHVLVHVTFGGFKCNGVCCNIMLYSRIICFIVTRLYSCLYLYVIWNFIIADNHRNDSNDSSDANEYAVIFSCMHTRVGRFR